MKKNNSISIEKLNSLKLIAMITMLIDHIGYVFFPEKIGFRIIGRLSFPLYAYFLVEGYKYTSNVNNYLKRLFILAIVSQTPYMLMTNTIGLNIIFNLLLGLYLMLKLDENRYYWLLIIPILSECLNVGYGIYGIGLILILRYIGNSNYTLFITMILNVLSLVFLRDSIYQIYSVFGVLIIVYIKDYMPKINMNRNFYYLFYPLHMLILWVISVVFR